MLRRILPRPCPPLWLLTAAAALAAAPWVDSQPPTKKLPIGSQSQRARAEALVRKLYTEEYAEAKKNPAAALALASTLLRESKETKDDPVLNWSSITPSPDCR
jgi:hypothetical protein